MGIWTYNDISRQPELSAQDWIKLKECPYCQEIAQELHKGFAYRQLGSHKRHVQVCSRCGWWRAEEEVIELLNQVNQCLLMHRALVPSLKNLDLTDISTPIEEVRAYLAAKYEARFQVNPQLMEETVASVFRDLGYHTRVTGRSGDDGIDIIFDKGREVIGVQVKRYRGSIKVEQIRSLAGALVLNGLTRGIFVTTSTFQSGAEETTRRLVHWGYRIELIDAARFYEALSIAQRIMYSSLEEFEISQRLPLFLPIILEESTIANPFRKT